MYDYKPGSYGFDPYSGMNHFNLPVLVTRQICLVTQHAICKLGEIGRTECFNLPTLQYVGYSVKRIITTKIITGVTVEVMPLNAVLCSNLMF